MFKHALTLAAQLGPVLPVHTALGGDRCSCSPGKCRSKPGKHPRHRDWQNAATRDPAQIALWWQEAPSANIGLLTGARAGFFADEP